MVVKPIPKWAMQRYAKLWGEFKYNEFDYTEATNLLKEKDQNLVSALLSYLRKNGWMVTKLHPVDKRKRIYQLIPLENIIKDLSDIQNNANINIVENIN